MSPLFFEKTLSDIKIFTKKKKKKKKTERERERGKKEKKRKSWKAEKAAKKGVNDFDPEERFC